MLNTEFYKGKKVLITGATGFKGSWLCEILLSLGAKITGYSIDIPIDNNFFELLELDKKIEHIIGDVRDLEHLLKVFKQVQPEIVIHLAAQPIVRTSYEKPVYTYETNVLGTVNVLECVRVCNSVKSFLNVTTDKVYKNNEWKWGYREIEYLDGYDPYSNSKSCSELVTHSYKRSFFEDDRVKISTARAGNVIGGGDLAKDRIIPDCVRAAINNEKVIIRNPHSVRPYQHVLEPLFAYLMILQKQYDDSKYSGCYNVGPNEEDCITTGKIADLFCKYWGNGMTWENVYLGGPHEASFLKLDCSKIKYEFGWKPTWNIEKAVEKTVEFAKIYHEKGNVKECVNAQIYEFLKDIGEYNV